MRDPAMLRPPAGRTTDDIAPVWVLDDPMDEASDQAIAVAERLGVPHLRVPLAWRWRSRVAGVTRRGSLGGLAAASWPLTAPRGPALAISAGSRSGAVALWLRDQFGTRIVHCGRAPWQSRHFDLLAVPQHLGAAERPNVLPVLGEPNRLSPLVLSQARVAWAGRMAHLPRPLVTLLAGGGLRAGAANEIARQVARMAVTAGGSVVASTTPSTGGEAADALAAGLATAMHVLYRWGEPGENPYAAMIALADVLVVTPSSTAMLSEACGGDAPVFIAGHGRSTAQRRLADVLVRAGQARPLNGQVAPWTRIPLDEAGRVAGEIRARMSIGPLAVD